MCINFFKSPKPSISEMAYNNQMQSIKLKYFQEQKKNKALSSEATDNHCEKYRNLESVQSKTISLSMDKMVLTAPSVS